MKLVPMEAPRPKYPADRMRSYAVIEQEAARARRLLGFGPEEPLPSMKLFERLDTLKTGPGVQVSYRVQVLREGVEAETRFDLDTGTLDVILAEGTYCELEADVPRARFSLAHEIGHAVQHCAEVMRLSTIPRDTAALMRGRFANLRAYEDCEWQANAFAGALLMPARALWKLELAGQLTVQSVSRQFQVSRQAAETRLEVFQKKKEVLVR